MLPTFLSLWSLTTGCGEVSANARGSLYDANANTRLEALYRMSPAEKELNVSRLVVMAESDPEPDVQHTALALLGTTGSPDAVPTLHRMLHDFTDGDAQVISARALGTLNNIEACAAMVEAWIHWVEPPTDHVAMELREALVRARSVCQPVVREQVREFPDRLRPIMGDMSRG